MLVSGVLGDARATPSVLADVIADGPALIGLVVAAGAAIAVRSGGRGGPLAIEAPDVHHVLLSPVDRGAAIRGLALRQARTGAFLGIVLGLVAANLAFRRLPGAPSAWLVLGALFGLLVPVLMFGAALIASGRRIGPRWATLAALAVIAWSVADVLLHATTSPATWLGTLALGAIEPDPVPAAAGGALVAVLVAALGILWVGGTSLEASLRRASLVAQLRFAVTLQDLRTVILLRRQLAAERPRSRPWVRLRADGPLRSPVWRRGWQSFLRWPVVRIVRLVVLGGVAGVTATAAWAGTTPLYVVAALALLVAALDAVEPLAQEVDHPGRADPLPVDRRRLARWHMVAPGALMLVAGLFGVAAAVAVGGGTTALTVGPVVAIGGALGALCGAAFSVTSDPFASPTQPALQYVRMAVPFVLALIGIAPALAARASEHAGSEPVSAAFAVLPLIAAPCVIAVWWVGRSAARAAEGRAA